MRLGLRNWLLAVAGIAAMAALVTLILYFIGLEFLADRDARAALGPELYDRVLAGEVDPEALQTLDEIYLFYLSYWFIGLGFLIAFVVAGVIGWLGANPLLRHVTGLRNTAASVREGNLAARVPNYRASAVEIERFSRDFNMLIARVERAERESRESAAALAHELRTPLTVISGRLQGMLDGVFPSDRSGLELLQRQVELLNRLVKDLRFLTLFEAGRMAFHTRTLALDDLVREILVAYPGVSSALAPLQVQGDPERLTQAIIALVDNAQRHAGGADRVELVQEGREAVLRVLDQGPGISESDAQRVFDRFFRAESAVGDGSGLGLSVVRAVVRGHGGTIHARARPEGGSVFEIRLALHEAVVSTKSP